MVQTSRKLELLLILILLQINFWALGNCSSCETPNDWLSGDITIQRKSRSQAVSTQPQNPPGETWPNGLVSYKLDSSLTFKDTLEVQKAFRQYHVKTCVRFTPWQEGDKDFVRIEVDNDVCGFSNVCKIGGEQVVRFGKDCRNMATIVHQLGHTLCLGHEHQRLDRDRFVNFSSCDTIPPKIKSFRRPLGIYDYNSQMHSQCNSCDNGGGFPIPYGVHACGPDVTLGLSVMDVDKINFLYNCQGCQRHRWIPAVSLTKEDFEEMYTFGYQSSDGSPMYLCRAEFHAEVVSGMYNSSRKTCNIPWGGRYEIEGQVEVLTIPGGLIGRDCSNYKLVNSRDATVHTYVNVGNLARPENRNWTSIAAYSPKVGEVGNRENSIGKYWVVDGKQRYSLADFIVGDRNFKSSKFNLLTCKVDSTCKSPTTPAPTAKLTAMITEQKIEIHEHGSVAKNLMFCFAGFLVIGLCCFLAYGAYIIRRGRNNINRHVSSDSLFLY